MEGLEGETGDVISDAVFDEASLDGRTKGMSTIHDFVLVNTTNTKTGTKNIAVCSIIH